VRGRHEDVDARADIYGLGVVCFEVLTGRLPQDLRGKVIAEAARVITEEDPKSLGSTGQFFPVDLETIVGKCLAKERERRYASASELAADLRRFLNDEPLAARPPSAVYQFRKFARRNRAALAIVAIVVLSIVAFAVNATIQARRVAVEAEAAKQVSDLLVGLFQSIDPAQARGDTVTVREVLDRGVDDILANEDVQPLVRARALQVLGEVYQHLGNYEQAEPLLKKAIEDMETGDADPDDLVRTYAVLGYNHEVQGDYDTALEYYNAGLAVADERLPYASPARFAALTRLGMTTMRRDGYEAGGRIMEETLAEYDATDLPRDQNYATLLNDLGIAYQKLGRHEEAADLYRRSIDIYEGEFGSDNPKVARGLNNLAYVYLDMGDYEKALAVQERGTELTIRLVGENHRDTANSLNIQGAILKDMERYDEAIVILNRAIEAFENSVGPEHPHVAYPHQNMAHAYKALEQYDKALEHYTRALEIRRAAHGPDHHTLSWTQVFIGQLYIEMGDTRSAEPHLRDAHRIVQDKFPELHAQRTRVVLLLADVLTANGEYDESESLLLGLHEKLWAAEDGSHSRRKWTAESLAELYEAQGNAARAQQYRQELASLEASEEAE
jgi:tetratricopeptide (TPR) repeat protein